MLPTKSKFGSEFVEFRALKNKTYFKFTIWESVKPQTRRDPYSPERSGSTDPGKKTPLWKESDLSSFDFGVSMLLFFWEWKNKAKSYIPYHPWDWHIFSYIWLISMGNVGKNAIHGWYGNPSKFKSAESQKSQTATSCSKQPGHVTLDTCPKEFKWQLLRRLLPRDLFNLVKKHHTHW